MSSRWRFRHRYRSGDRCGYLLSSSSINQRSNFRATESSILIRKGHGRIDTIIKDRSARWPVPATKREGFSPSPLFSLERALSPPLIDLSLFFWCSPHARGHSSRIHTPWSVARSRALIWDRNTFASIFFPHRLVFLSRISCFSV